MLRVKKRIALVAMCVVSAACVGQPHGTPTRVIIPRGASFGQATDSLARGGLVGWPKTFRLYGRLTGGDRNIKPGTYLLKHGTPWNAIIGALEAHTTMSTQALDSETVRRGIRDVLLGPARLYESLRGQASDEGTESSLGN